VDDEVKRAIQEAVFEFVGPERFRAEVVEWCDLVLVAHCRHRVDLEVDLGVCSLEGIVDDLGLDEGELRSATADIDSGDGGVERRPRGGERELLVGRHDRWICDELDCWRGSLNCLDDSNDVVEALGQPRSACGKEGYVPCGADFGWPGHSVERIVIPSGTFG